MVPIPFFKLVGFFLYIVVFLYVTEAHQRYPDEKLTSVFFKLLPMCQLLFVVMSTDKNDQHKRDDGFDNYKKYFTLALMFSMVGDACLVWRVQLFIPGLLFFAVAQALYAKGFGFKPLGSVPTLMSCAIVAGMIYMYLLPGIKEGPRMQGLALMYMLLIFTMGWRAVVQCQWNTNFSTIFGVIGAFVFITSDFIIAYDKWVAELEMSSLMVMATYYTAQMFMALSAAGYVSSPKID